MKMMNNSRNKKIQHKSYMSLLKPGNVGMTRLLLAIYDAGDEGITTLELLKQLNSITHGHYFLKRAEREKLITRERVKRPGQKGNWYTINKLTNKGKALLLTQFPQPSPPRQPKSHPVT